MKRAILCALATPAVAAVLVGGAAGVSAVDGLTISPPADITVAADSVCGQSNCVQVFYTYTVTGGVPPYHLVCNLDSGSFFLVGAHVISCLAQDSVGDSTPQATFNLTVTPGGPTPPPPPPPPPGLTITPPADMTVQATTPCGTTYCTQVNFTFAVSGGYPPYRLVCTRYSGETFTVGTWTPACLAQDSVGNSTPQLPFTLTVLPPTAGGGTGGSGGAGGSGSGSSSGGSSGSSGSSSGSGGSGGATGGTGAGESARDTTPPNLVQHSNIAVDASRPGGVIVTYRVGASDPGNTTDAVNVSCVPASGSFFRLGSGAESRTTTVTCHATDAAHNAAAPMTFAVTVRGVHPQILELERQIAQAHGLPSITRSWLKARLTLADRFFAANAKTQERAELSAVVRKLLALPTTNGAVAVWIRAERRIRTVSG